MTLTTHILALWQTTRKCNAHDYAKKLTPLPHPKNGTSIFTTSSQIFLQQTSYLIESANLTEAAAKHTKVS